MTMDMPKLTKPEKVRLVEVNPHLTCYLCKGYFIDATTISECLHSFCRSCLIKFLQDNSYCPICEVLINKTKPNIKLDKTLQDIVYKLIPELFLNEMLRRKKFYQNHPEAAAKATPEDRGEDTERTIFSPRDSISLSIEFIREDSTPGAIKIPSSNGKFEVDEKQAKHSGTDLDSTPIRRYLQCPGMCRVEVLKKFICNKYNVDINKFYIDILYKRVPLPDHYTLIDIAYIYSWKRNEPMKFFFKIIDVEPSAVMIEDLKFETPKKTRRCSKSRRKSLEKIKVRDIFCSDNENDIKLNVKKSDNVIHHIRASEGDVKTPIDNSLDSSQNLEEKSAVKNIKNCLVEVNSTCNNNNNKVNNNKGSQKLSPKVTKKLIKNPSSESVVKAMKQEIMDGKNSKVRKNGHDEVIINLEALKIDVSCNEVSKVKVENTDDDLLPKEDNSVEIDPEKSKFLESIELTAKKSLSPQKEPPITIKMEVVKEPVLKEETKEPKNINASSAQKRKNSSPTKNEKGVKKQKIVSKRKAESKNIQNPTVRQMVSNVHHNASNVSKIVEQSSPKASYNKSDLQSLFDSCKINIPSSLSITIKEGSEDKNTPPVRPVKNYIEILKIPDNDQKHNNEDDCRERPKLNITVSTNSNVQKVIEINSDEDVKLSKNKEIENSNCSSDSGTITANKSSQNQAITTTKVVASTFVTEKNPNTMKVINLVAKNNCQSFQKMFEESVKNFKLLQSIENVNNSTEDKDKAVKDDTAVVKPPKEKTPQKIALDLSTETNNTNPNGTKKNILEIAHQLYKKSKLEQNKTENGTSGEGGNKIRHISAIPSPNYTPSTNISSRLTQTLSNLHSPSLGMNYTVSVTQSNSPKMSRRNSQALSPGLNKVATSPKKSPVDGVCNNKPIEIVKKESGVGEHIVIPTTSSVGRSMSGGTCTVVTAPELEKSPSKIAKLSPKHRPSKSCSPRSSTNANTKTDKESIKKTESDSVLNPNEILEKYNIANLAQLTANFNIPVNYGMLPAQNQLAALHQAMILRHFEMQNRQNWLNMNPSPLVQYEKYLKSLNQKQGQILSKDN